MMNNSESKIKKRSPPGNSAGMEGGGIVLFLFVLSYLVLYCFVYGVSRTVLRVSRTVYCVSRTVLRNEDSSFKNTEKTLIETSSQVSRYSLIILRIHAFLNA